jgi:predicted DNA-binding protein (MmcQ/YjbR family)
MTRRELIDYCLTYPDAYEDYPFDDVTAAGSWTVMRHRLNKKGFAFIYERDGLCVNLKCEPLRADFLRQLYEGVTPAYHMNKTHWNTVLIDADVPEEDLYDLIEHSYRLTMAKKTMQRIE